MPRKKKEDGEKTAVKKTVRKRKTAKPKADSKKTKKETKTPKKKSTKATTTEKTVQPVVNIGMIGHVDHGKTTLTECLSGKWTDTHSEELKKGITIRLGYANCAFYKDATKKGTEAYTISPQTEDGKPNELLRKISIVDAPGHESLMATMLAGATIMHGAMVLISATETCPQPQTAEHIKALEIMGIKHVIIVQNKIDLVDEEQAIANYKEIKAFLADTMYKDAPIVPISAQFKVNIDVLIETIENTIPTPQPDLDKPARMFIARSFDINKPGQPISVMKGGVIGGAVQQGKFSVGDEIEIKPGHETEEKNQKIYKPIRTTITGIMSGSDSIDTATPGGSVAFLTKLDPNVVKSDKLTGNLVGKPGELPETLNTLTLKTQLLERVVGAKDHIKVDPIKKGEVLMLNVNAAATVGMVTELGKDKCTCKLKIPVCSAKGSRVTISRVVHSRFRLIGFGIIE
ncbi:MAG: translation initiation factor IF-2 subunit gamma [Candidatus Woesearchaeota archaeon]